MKILNIKKPNFEIIITDSLFDYERYDCDEWYYYASEIESKVDEEYIEKLETLYQEFKKNNKL